MHQQKGKKILFYFFLLIFLGSITNIKFNNIDLHKIKIINVSGLDKKNNEYISNSLKNFYFQNIFFVNPNDLKKIIEANKLIENYKIIKRYPSTIDIELKKTKFIAKINKNENIYIVGTNGKLINNNSLNSELPFIFGNPEVKEILLLKKIIDQSKFSFSEIKKLYYFKSRRWDIEFNNKIFIKLPTKNIEETLNYIFLLHENKNMKKVKVYDARVVNQIIINE